MVQPIVVTGGSIGYKAPTFSYGQTTQAINGGYSFDLPLSTVAAFTNNALAFSEANSKNAQGFFSGIFARAQEGVSNQATQAFAYQDKSLGVLQGMQEKALAVQKYGLKKQYSTGNLLKPGSQCFITTAICKASGLPDDTWQLQLLRKFRDDYLLTTDEGCDLVQRYYDLAPRIVEAIDKLSNASSIYAYLAGSFIQLALQQISVQNFEGATGTYSAMVKYAQELAGIEDVQEVAVNASDDWTPTWPDETAPAVKPEFHPLGD